MGTGSSREHRRQAAVVRQQQLQQQPPPMPYHLQQQFRSQPNAAASAPPSAFQQRSAPVSGGVQEGQKIKILATVEPSSVHYEPNNQLLTFRVTSQVPGTVFYEVHVAVRETIAKDKVVYTPNKPKLAPERIALEGPQDDVELACVLDLGNVTDQEMRYNKAYPKQRPCVIVLEYRDESGAVHSEHTSVDLNAEARRTVICQVVSSGGSCYAVESLFGGEHEEVTVGSVMTDGGEQEGGTSPAAGVAAEDDDDGLCVICLTLEKDTAVIPCRHLCLCKECAEQLMKHTPKCPVCRGPISQLLHMPK